MGPEQSFLSDSERRTPLWFALGGTLISLLAGTVVYMVLRSREALVAGQD